MMNLRIMLPKGEEKFREYIHNLKAKSSLSASGLKQ